MAPDAFPAEDASKLVDEAVNQDPERARAEKVMRVGRDGRAWMAVELKGTKGTTCADGSVCARTHAWRHVFPRHRRSPPGGPRLEPAYRHGLLMPGADGMLWSVHGEGHGRKWARTTRKAAQIPKQLVTGDGRAWEDVETGETRTERVKNPLTGALEPRFVPLTTRTVVFATRDKKRNPAGSPRVEPAYEVGYARTGEDQSAWVVAAHPSLGRVWARGRKVTLRSLRLSDLRRGVPIRVYFKYAQKGQVMTEDKGRVLTPLHGELDGARVDLTTVQRMAKDAVGDVYIITEEDGDDGDLVVCAGGRLATNCITPESYALVERTTATAGKSTG